jgi:hypothetical protein
MDPILELVGYLLEDGAGGISSSLGTEVTTDQWLTWNQLSMEQHGELARTITTVLEEEMVELPRELTAMPQWAACLLLSALDRMGME